MKFAIPIAEKKLALHFGHAQEFCILEVDENTKKVIKKEFLTPPPHEPGVLPAWLSSLKVQLVIAGGMGQRAVSLLNESGISVLIGASAEDPEKLVGAYLNNALKLGANVCGHDPNSPCSH